MIKVVLGGFIKSVITVVKKIIVGVLVLVLLYGLNYAWRALPIISGYGAKNLCSCVFVSGREVNDVRENELKVNPLLSVGTFEVNMTDNSTSGSVFGLVKKVAIYRKGLGCTLVSELTEEEVRSQKNYLSTIKTPSDTLIWPSGSLEIDSEVAGVNYDKLQAAIDNAFVEDNSDTKINTRGVVVIYKDSLIAEQYSTGFNKNTPQMGWSMTKSITATILGMMMKDGLVTLDQDNLFDEWADDERSKITLDQLLRMSSGLDWEEVYSGPSKAVSMLYEKADMGGFAADQDLAYQPDEKWYYSSGTSNILAIFIRERLGDSNYLNYVRNRLFSPLGMSSAVMEIDASGTYVSSSYMYATPRDWAKFGLLYLNNGLWEGKRLLSKDWIDYISTPTLGSTQRSYGGHFWLNAGEESNAEDRVYPDAPTDVFSANGFEGQRVFVIPSKELVIVRTGQTKVRGSFDFNKFLKEVIDSVE